MKIGIIVFSRTGNTLLVAEKLRAALQKQGHTAEIQRVHAQHEDPNDKTPVRLTEIPNPAAYDAVVFGAPVQAFSLTGIMKAYMRRLPRMNGQKAALFVTQQFPKPWMGGRQALGFMRSRCREKGAEIIASGGVNWGNQDRNAQIDSVVAALAEGWGIAV